ncbi:hypothetical protein ACH5RR_021719 [Cinchona calisaya]|uniref:Isopenicillin N synthase-like Fe(2+) 2OG dioxygenase domain-containing protein n=1 Tax=Cinchona calisaya TaxID=153742 RepID=A0ABD2ZLB0_9GENT
MLGSLIRRLLQILIGNLGVNLEELQIESLIGMKMVNMNLYPTCLNPKLIVGVGCHSNMRTLTVLLQDGVGRLYIKVEEDAIASIKEEWIEIPSIISALVINLGDTLQVRPQKTCSLLI